MTELSFAKQFLTALDSRPIKLSSDHVADPRTYPAQSAYTLPHLPNPKRKRTAPSTATNPGAVPSTPSPTISVTLKNLRTPSQSLNLPPQAPKVSIHDLKALYAAHVALPVDKVKLLKDKKPCADSKTLKELLPEGQHADAGVSLEFTVMLLGGAAAGAAGASPAPTPERVATPPPQEPEAMEGVTAEARPNPADEPVVQGASGADMLGTEEFWEDLKGFLVQRLRDAGEGERLVGVFREALRGELKAWGGGMGGYMSALWRSGRKA